MGCLLYVNTNSHLHGCLPTPLCRALVAGVVWDVRKLQQYAMHGTQQWEYKYRWSSVPTVSFVTKFDETNIDGCIIQLSRKFSVTRWTLPRTFLYLHLFFRMKIKSFLSCWEAMFCALPMLMCVLCFWSMFCYWIRCWTC